MAPKAFNKDEANRMAAEYGWFNALDKMIPLYGLTPQQVAKLKAGMFGLLLAKVKEAKDEISRLQASVERLEAGCRAGIIPNPAEGNRAWTATTSRVAMEMDTFDGWTISLLESDISMLAAVRNPESAGNRIRGLQKAFAELWAVRIQDGFKMMARHPEAFENLMMNFVR